MGEKEKNQVLSEEIEVEPVKKRRVGGTDALTIPTILTKSLKCLRIEPVKYAPRVERTPEGRILLIFEQVKDSE